VAATSAPATQVPLATVPAPSAWQEEILNLESDGRRSLDSALKLFVMAFGPLPGVDATTAAAGTVDSATPALRVLRERRDELTQEQRDAIDEMLAPSDDDVILEIGPAGAPEESSSPIPQAVAGAIEQGYDPLERDLKRIGDQARTAAARYFGDIPQFELRVTRNISGPWLSFFNPTFGPAGFEKCDVFVNEDTAGGNLGATGRSITLDAVHCFQSWKMGSEQGFDGNVPAWAWDGPAEYISLGSWPTQEDDVLYLATYFLLPDVSLFERANDAAAYYAQAWEAGVDLNAAFVAVLTDVDDAQRFALAGTKSGAFLDKWASELARSARGDWGPDWNVVLPGTDLSSVRAPLQGMSVAHGSLEAFSQDAYTNHVFAMHSDADIVSVEAMGRARVGDGVVDAIISGSAYFCTTEKGCGPCPDGSDPIIQPVRLAPDSLFAVTGGTDGTNGTVSGHPLEEFCLPSPPPTPGKALRAHIERPAMPDYAFMAGTVFDVTSCDGPYGPWAGYMGAGGLATQGQVVVPWQELPIDFTFPGGEGTQTTNVTAAGVVIHKLPVPQQIDVSYPLVITVDEDTMTVVGLAGFVNGQSPITPIEVPLEPAPPGTCVEL
jgi:hypothetical protein